MIQPICSDAELLAEIQECRGDDTALSLWWLGQSGFLVQYRGQHLLLDPYLSDSLTRKYADTDKPHVRMTAQVIAPDQLDFVDVVTSSHNHTDHLDAETLLPLWRVNPDLTIVVPRANRRFAAERLNADPSTLTDIAVGRPVTCGSFELHAVPAAHESVECDEDGNHRFIGVVVRCGPWAIYHSGDTLRYADQVSRLREHHIDVALLPINGSHPARRVAGNLNGEQAAELAHEIGAGCVIPCHYEMFEFNTASPRSFVDRCRELGQPYAVLRCGERWNTKETES